MIGATELKVGIGDMKFSRGEGRIITYALGSCIGITFYDPSFRSEEHTSELQSPMYLVCRLLLEKKNVW